jgi:type I restriction enzyme S subunit
MKTATKTKFKQTEIGKSPELGTAGEWRQARLAEICVHSAFGPRFSGELYAPDGNVATLRTTDISEDGRIEYATMPLARLDLSKFQQHLLHEDDLVVTRTGRVGTTAVFDGFRLPVLAGAFLIRFRLNRELAEPHFYRYYFNSPEGRALITSVATGSVQQNLNITSLHGLVIPVPPLREQRAIAHILCTLDDKIELNHQMNKTLEAIGQAIFKHWFIDFEFPNEEGKPYKSSRGELVASELGLIPAGWRISNVGKEVQIGGGSTPDTSEPRYWDDGNSHWTTPKDLANLSGPILLDTARKITELGLSVIGGRLYPKGTLLLSSRAPIGYLAISEVPTAVNQGIIAIVPDKTVSNYYMLAWCRANIEEIKNRANGTTFLEISKSDFREMSIIIPPQNLMNHFSPISRSIYSLIHFNTKESVALQEIRDSLLPKLVSGKKRVPVEVR